MICKKCDYELPTGSEVCNRCGEVVKKEKKKSKSSKFGLWFDVFIIFLFGSVVSGVIMAVSDIWPMLKLLGVATIWFYTLLLLLILIHLVSIGFPVYTLYSIFKLKPNAIALAKMYLILNFLASVSTIMLGSQTEAQPTTLASAMTSTQALIQSLIYSVIWFLYLIFSGKVNIIFPKEKRITKTIDKVFFSSAIILIIISVLVGLFANTESDKSISEIVSEAKSETTLPLQIDEITQLVDITAEQNAIRTHYIISPDIGPDELSSESLKNDIKLNICDDDYIKLMFDRGINFEYSYIIENTEQEYFIALSKEDCLNE